MKALRHTDSSTASLFQREDEADLAFAARCWRYADEREYELWLHGSRAERARIDVPEWFQTALDAALGREAVAAGHAQAFMSEQLGMTVYGYYDEDWREFHPSQTMGPASGRRVDRDDCYFAARLTDEDDRMVLRRWDRPDDELDVLEAIREESFGAGSSEDGLNLSAEAVWTERMTAFREEQLHGLLRTYFGTHRYMSKEIVLRWKRNPNGKFIPAEKRYVGQWIAEMIDGRLLELEDGSYRFVGGNRLDGVTACCGFIRSKMARRMASRGEASFREAYAKVVAQ